MTGKRIRSIDVLRGLMASGIMIYHNYVTFYEQPGSGHLLEKIGVYGVSIFYVLSGLTLYLVYKNSLELNTRSIVAFYIRRVFRIFPLLWITVFATMLIRGKILGWKVILLNLTGGFGLVHRTEYIAVGQWSIGNELVFYLLFPLYFFAAKYSRYLFYALLLLSALVGVYFAFSVLEPGSKISDQWNEYIHPLNQFWLFSGGILIGYLVHKWDLSARRRLIDLLFFASILVFAFYPSSGDSIAIVSELNRVVFVMLCWFLCFSSYFQDLKVPKPVSSFFIMLGEASYSVYLLHPPVLLITKKMVSGLPPPLMICLSVATTLVVSWLVYVYFEKYFMGIGGKLAKFTVNKNTAHDRR